MAWPVRLPSKRFLATARPPLEGSWYAQDPSLHLRKVERNMSSQRSVQRNLFIAWMTGIFLGMALGVLLFLLFSPRVARAEGLEPGDPRVLVYTGSYTGTWNAPWTGATRTSPNGGGIAIGSPTGDPTDDGTIGRYFDYRTLQLNRAAQAAEEALVRIHFDFDKSNIEPQYEVEIDRVAGLLRANPEISLRLDGHTDLVGTRNYNYALGERRAIAIQRALIARGIEEDRVRVLSFGEASPRLSTPARERENRRVESGVRISIPGLENQ